jgi:MFS family permease
MVAGDTYSESDDEAGDTAGEAATLIPKKSHRVRHTVTQRSNTTTPPRAGCCSACTSSTQGCDPSIRGLVVITACFTLLFAGWVPMENLLSTYEGDLGYYCLMTVYLAVVPGSFVAPWIMARAGPRSSMFIAAVPYTCFAGALVLKEFGIGARGEVLYPCAVGVGLGCGVLWGSQGVLLRTFSEAFDISQTLRTKGRSTGSLGLFNGIGQAAAPAGGLLALIGSSLMAQFDIGRRTLYTSLFVSLALGNVLLFAMPDSKQLLVLRRSQLRELGQTGVYGPGGDNTMPSARLPVSILAIPRLLLRSQVLCYLQFCFCSGGYANAFMAGSFTADIVARHLGPEWIGFVMAARNVAGVLSGVGLGRLSDRVGRYRCYLVSLSCEGVLALYCCVGSLADSGTVVSREQATFTIFVLVAFMGVGNAGSQTLLRSIQGDEFDETEVGTALSAGSVSGSACQVLGYLAGPLLPLQARSYALFGLWCAAGIGAALGSAASSRAKQAAGLGK